MQWFNEVCLPRFSLVTILALLATLILIFAFQSENIRGRYFHSALIAIPIHMHEPVGSSASVVPLLCGQKAVAKMGYPALFFQWDEP